ncbi:MAG: tetratricopeptide repeat protein [Bacteroidota bacterium]
MRWFAALILVCIIQTAYADEVSVQFDQANQLYRNGEFQQSAVMYEQIVKNGYGSPELFFNLGNAYFKLKNIPAAIINYERAKRLAPHDEDITYNLRLANLRVVDKIEPVPTLFLMDWWKSLVNVASADGWAIGGIVSIWGVMIFSMIFLVVRSFFIRRAAFLLGFLAVFIGILCYVGVVQRERIELSDKEAIVFNQSTPAKSAPDPQSTDLFVIHEGVKVEILDSVGEWRKIRLLDGKIGWINSETIESI